MLLPLVAWCATGAVFLVKPGYQGAYEMISPKLYEIEENISIQPQDDWLDARLLRTVLGYHLLVKTPQESLHLDPISGKVRALPSDKEIAQLLRDAVSANNARYGEILEGEGSSYSTSTGVSLTLDWQNLRISQYGRDTWLIDTLYKVHYLQWLGNSSANKVLGVLGLVLLLLLVSYGFTLYLSRRAKA